MRAPLPILGLGLGLGLGLTLSSVGCGGKTPPSDEECEAAAERLVEIFSDANADDRLARRAAERQHKNFYEACQETGSRAQALCTAQAQSVADLEACE